MSVAKCVDADAESAGVLGQMPISVRRVVTATNEAGQSFFMIDGPAGNVLEQPGRGLTFHELWVTTGPLASNEGVEDAAAVPVTHHPPHGGSRIRIVEFLPDEQHVVERSREDFAAIEATDRLVGDGSDAGMHRNETVDYNIVLSGEIYAKTDLDEILLHPGDVLIQRGTNHTWHNRSTAPCVFASIMISANVLPVHADRAVTQPSTQAEIGKRS